MFKVSIYLKISVDYSLSVQILESFYYTANIEPSGRVIERSSEINSSISKGQLERKH